jgi:hypothetical protein
MTPIVGVREAITVALGIDADQDVRPILSELKAQGVEFVCRYLGHSTKKSPLTLSEAKAISDAGLFVVSIWESGNPTDRSYFTYAQGERDGLAAYDAAEALGQPPGTPIYFACGDYDSPLVDVEVSFALYLQGIRDTWAEQNPNRNPTARFLLGNYGNGLACETLKARGLVHFTWLAMPTDWGGSGYAGYNIHQTHGGTIDGVDLDWDESSELGGGGWKLPSA